MIKLSKKTRRLLRAVYRGLGITATSLALNACDAAFIQGPCMYGPPPPPRPCCQAECIYIVGQVRAKNTGQPIPGIFIRVYDGTSWVSWASSDSEGNFSIDLPKRDEFTLVFADMDGTENGLFARRTISMTWAEAEAIEGLMIVELEANAE